MNNRLPEIAWRCLLVASMMGLWLACGEREGDTGHLSQRVNSPNGKQVFQTSMEYNTQAACKMGKKAEDANPLAKPLREAAASHFCCEENFEGPKGHRDLVRRLANHETLDRTACYAPQGGTWTFKWKVMCHDTWTPAPNGANADESNSGQAIGQHNNDANGPTSATACVQMPGGWRMFTSWSMQETAFHPVLDQELGYTGLPPCAYDPVTMTPSDDWAATVAVFGQEWDEDLGAFLPAPMRYAPGCVPRPLDACDE